MFDRTLFALGFGVGLPALLIALGADLPPGRLAAWGVVGFTFGWAIPTALDWLFQWGRAEEISIIRSRDANSEFTEAKAAEIRAKIDSPIEVVEDRAEIERAWRSAFERFIIAGNLHGFKVRNLGAGPHKVVEWEDWGRLREPLIDIGVLEERGGTRWAEGWDYARWQKEGAAIPLPFLKGMPPPVGLTVTTAQKQQKQQTTEAEGVGVGG